MADYLQPAARGWRIACFVGAVVATALCLLASVILWTGMITERRFVFDGKPLWIGAVIIAAVGAASAFIAVRLVRGETAANGVTTMPLWFIQAFGVFLLIGIEWAAYAYRDLAFALEGLLMCLAMILVGRNVARKRRQAPNRPAGRDGSI